MVKINFSEGFINKMKTKDAVKLLTRYYDSKFGKGLVIRYRFNTFIPYAQNIKNVFKQSKNDDIELINYYSKYVTNDMSNDTKVIELAKAVNDRLTYKSDKQTWGTNEYWAKPIEIHNKQTEDCDGYACLTCYLWGLFGIPSFRRYVRAGDVFYRNGNYAGGHATAIYLTESDMEFYPIEGSFYTEESLRFYKRIPLRKNKKYAGKTWFITNENDSYLQNKFKIMFFRGSNK